jgi:hypothetical protein
MASGNNELARVLAEAETSASSASAASASAALAGLPRGPNEKVNWSKVVRSLPSSAAVVSGNAASREKVSPFLVSKFQPGNIPIPFLNTMDTNAKKNFKPALNAINAKRTELAQLAKRIQNQHAPLNAAIKSKRGVGALNIGDKSFMGRNGPRVYVANNGSNYVVRGNFMQNGLPFRVSNPNSFNAVLANMKAKRQNVSRRMGNLRSITQTVNALEKSYGAKQVELAKMVKTLQKEHEEYLSRRAKQARATRRTILPSAAPSAMTSAAKKELEVPKQPGFFGRLFGRGGTRRRSRSQKTRKNRRNTRR